MDPALVIAPVAPVVTTVDQSGPLDAGHTTTEFYIAKVVMVLSSAAAVLGFLVNIAEKAQLLLPSTPWLTAGVSIAGIASLTIAQLIYTLSRWSLKTRALNTPPAAVIPVGPGTTHDKAVAALDV